MGTAISRKLSETESKSLRRSLLEKWNFSFDQPSSLTERSPHPVVTVAKDDMTEVNYNQVIQVLSLYTSRVLELAENGTGREYPVMSFHPDSADAVFCDDGLEWIIYASFDGRLIFGGEWLSAWVKKMFSGSKDNILIKKKRNRAR